MKKENILKLLEVICVIGILSPCVVQASRGPLREIIDNGQQPKLERREVIEVESTVSPSLERLLVPISGELNDLEKLIPRRDFYGDTIEDIAIRAAKTLLMAALQLASFDGSTIENIVNNVNNPLHWEPYKLARKRAKAYLHLSMPMDNNRRLTFSVDMRKCHLKIYDIAFLGLKKAQVQMSNMIGTYRLLCTVETPSS